MMRRPVCVNHGRPQPPPRASHPPHPIRPHHHPNPCAHTRTQAHVTHAPSSSQSGRTTRHFFCRFSVSANQSGTVARWLGKKGPKVPCVCCCVACAVGVERLWCLCLSFCLCLLVTHADEPEGRVLEARLDLHDRLLGLCGWTNGSSDQTTPDQTFAAWLGMCARTRNSISLEPTRFTRLSCESEGAAAAAILRFAPRRSVWPLALPCPVLPRLRLSVWCVCVGTEMSLLGRGPTPASDVGQVRCVECGVWCSSRLRRSQVLASAASQSPCHNK